jgi:hypothetical protein
MWYGIKNRKGNLVAVKWRAKPPKPAAFGRKSGEVVEVDVYIGNSVATAAKKPVAAIASTPAPTAATEPEERSFETTVEVCAHRVAVRYWGFDAELTDELEEALTEAGEEHAKECITEGYVCGELNYLHTDFDNGDEQEEIRGWWEIERD